MKKYREFLEEITNFPEETIKDIKASLENSGIAWETMSYEELNSLLKKDFSNREASAIANVLTKG